MDSKEQMAFLKRMGLSVSRLDIDVEAKKKKIDNRVDKSELVSLARIFNVQTSATKKEQTLTEFLDTNKDSHEQ